MHLLRPLPGPCWFFPDPDLSESVRALLKDAMLRLDQPVLPALLRACRAVLRLAERRRPVPRCLIPVG